VRRTAVVGVLAAIVLMSCSGPRNGLNTPSSTCFRGLAAAGVAVGHKGEVVGVRIVRRDALADKVSQANRLAPNSVCAIAYRGDFKPGDVVGADPAGPGTYAVVVLNIHGSHVLATFVLKELPLRFRHRI